MKRCVVCKKELPEDRKVPLCSYHRERLKEGSMKVGGVAAGAGFVIKKYGKQIIETGKDIAIQIIKR